MINSIRTYHQSLIFSLLFCLLLVSTSSFSQELNSGVLYGNTFRQNKIGSYHYFTVGTTFEYRMKGTQFSFSTDPFLLIDYNTKLFTESFYMKLIIGKENLRLSPAFGLFFRSNKNLGPLIGLHVDYLLKNRLMLFVKSELFLDYYKDVIYYHFGPSTTGWFKQPNSVFSIGIKYNFFNKK